MADRPDRNPSPESQGRDLGPVVEELAEDMLELLKKVAGLEARMAGLASAVERLQQSSESSARTLGMELERLKQDLVSDRKELIGRTTFNALLPAVESLQAMKRRFEGRKGDEKLAQNTRTLLDLLTGILQALRYAPFEVLPGAAFDPLTMECVGYDSGESGTVIRVYSPGYKAGRVLVRPCGVILGSAPRKDG